MIYFPAPLLEYTPNLTFGDTFTASTGSTAANQLYCQLPIADIGDTILAFVHAKYPASTVFPTAGPTGSGANSGWVSAIGSGYEPIYGQLTVYTKKYNGTDTQIRVITENQSVLADISILTLRLKGMSSLVSGSYYSAGTGYDVLNGVSMPSLTISQRPTIPNYILFGMYGGLINTQYTSTDTPSNHNYLATIGTANTSTLISYIKSTDVSAPITATFIPTTGTRTAVMGYFQADNRGFGDTFAFNTSAVGIASTAAHYMLISNTFLHKARGYEEIYEFTIRIGNYTDTNPSGVFEIGVYDVTDGYNNATLCTSTTFNKVTKNALNKIPITPYRLTENRSYAIAFRSNMVTTMLVGSAYSGNSAVRRSTFLGTSSLQSTWSDSGTTADSRFAVGALVRYTPAAPDRKLKTIPSKVKQKTRKPAKSEINYQNPITRGLAILYAPEGIRGNLATKQRATAFGNNIVGYPEGLALSSQKIDIPFPITRNKLQGQISVLFFGKVDNISNYETILNITDTTANNYNSILGTCRNNAVNQQWQVTWGFGAGSIATGHSGVGFWTNDVTVGAFAKKKSGANQFNRFYKNGKFHSDSAASSAFTYNGLNNLVRIGDQSSGGNAVGRTYLLAVWDRDLTDAELASVTKDPYQLLLDPTSINYTITGYEDEPSSIVRVDDDNVIYPGQSNVSVTGRELLPGTSAKIKYGSNSLDMQNYTPATFPTFNMPPLNDYLSSNIPFGDVTFNILEKK